MKIRLELENVVSNSLANSGGRATTNSYTLYFYEGVKILLSVTVHYYDVPVSDLSEIVFHFHSKGIDYL